MRHLFLFFMAVLWLVMAVIYEDKSTLYLIMSQIWCAAGLVCD